MSDLDRFLQDLTALIVAYTALMSTWVRIKQIANGKKIDAAAEKIDTVHTQINGRMDELVATTADAANLQGRSDLKAEQSAPPQP